MKKNILMLSLCISAAIIAYASTASSTPVTERSPAGIGTYPVVGTNQDGFWDSDGKSIATPAAGTAFYGQDAQHPSKKSSYRNNGDGTISDMVTGLMWTQTTDRNGDAAINKADKLTYADAIKSASKVTLGGYNDWRLPTIKELYSLIRFNGQEPRPQDRSAAGLTPFIDSSIFGFGYGEVSAGERIIDSNYASSASSHRAWKWSSSVTDWRGTACWWARWSFWGRSGYWWAISVVPCLLLPPRVLRSPC